MIIQEIRKMSLECPRNSIVRWSKMQEEDLDIRLLLQVVGTVERIISLICICFFYISFCYIHAVSILNFMPKNHKIKPICSPKRQMFLPQVLYLDNALVELCRDEAPRKYNMSTWHILGICPYSRTAPLS